ncbi:hypothetical protein [Actinomadura sp. 9N215]|uniref:hypothetical protein n=1 Tax=Actinomadura sp. 9N215 TaxID=3375150 RepID=UPI0037B716B0
MPRHSAPASSEDVRMVEALRDQRPGVGGHVYSVYGPELVEYAEVLLGDHDRAVAAVRSAVLMLRDRPELVPSPEALQDWLYGLVRHQCREAEGRGRRRLVVAGVALTVGMLLLVEVTYGGNVTAPPVAMHTPARPSERPAPNPPLPPAPSPGGHRDAPEPMKTKPPPVDRHKPAGMRGRLAVDDRPCRAFHLIALPSTCHVRLTARGGPVTWSVAAVRASGGRISAGGDGELKPGRSASVPVTVRPTLLCHLGGSVRGTVSFAPGGTATIVYTCLSL